MKLSKSMLRVLLRIFKGAETLTDIANQTGFSENRCSELTIELESNGFANTSVAENFKKMYLSKPYMKYEEFLYGTKLDILQLLLYEQKNTATISKVLGISQRSVRANMKVLKKKSLIWCQNRFCVFAKEGYPLIYNFLNSLRNYVVENKRILWKFNNEEIFKTRDKTLVKGELTGLCRYEEFGIEVRTVEYYCSIPKRELSKKEVFIHSLLEIDKEPRLLGLAIAFYIKNNLKKANLDFLASKYDVSALLKEFKKTISQFKRLKENLIIKNQLLPSIRLSEIKRILDIYKVKNV